MTQQEIQERNKQIALMLGFCENQFKEIQTSIIEAAWICVEINVTYDTEHEDFPMLTRWDYLLFHSDWNWLMEAVEFINNIKIKKQYFYVNIVRSNIWIYQYKYNTTKCPVAVIGTLPEGKFKPLKETLFIAVSDFAKLYNNKEL
jgi:hypothetical protein